MKKVYCVWRDTFWYTSDTGSNGHELLGIYTDENLMFNEIASFLCMEISDVINKLKNLDEEIELERNQLPGGDYGVIYYTVQKLNDSL